MRIINSSIICIMTVIICITETEIAAEINYRMSLL